MFRGSQPIELRTSTETTPQQNNEKQRKKHVFWSKTKNKKALGIKAKQRTTLKKEGKETRRDESRKKNTIRALHR